MVAKRPKRMLDVEHLIVAVRFVFFFQAEDGIRDLTVTGVQTCALPISSATPRAAASSGALVPRFGPSASRAGAARASSRMQARFTHAGSSTPPAPGQIGRASCRERV